MVKTLLKNWKKLFVLTGGLLILFSLLFLFGSISYYRSVSEHIEKTFEQLRTSKGTRFYATPPVFQKEKVYSFNELEQILTFQNYTKATEPSELSPGQYSWKKITSDSPVLVIFRQSFRTGNDSHQPEHFGLGFEKIGEDNLKLSEIVNLNDKTELDRLDFAPKEIGYFFAGRLRTQQSVPLSDIPVFVRLAVMAIEDVRFLDHHGMSLRGTLRALYQDLIAFKWVQGGSTITQQLMKNLFFSKDKKIIRKLKEMIYALATEANFEKEDILQAYLNEVYLGQWSNHEIHGVAEASKYYFGRSVFDLDLAEAATLAAMIQRPNFYDPRKNPLRVLERRNLVLKKMWDADFIAATEFASAKNRPLTTTPETSQIQETGYFMDLVLDQMDEGMKNQINEREYNVYLTINPYLQTKAAQTLLEQLEILEKSFKNLKENSEKNIPLQGALIAVDLETCGVLALQGGRSYRQTQYNRILQSKRQPGSLFKPFVYLTGFSEKLKPPLTPLTVLDDEPFEWKYGKQSWKPENYDKKFRGPVSLKDALINSINVPTARVAEKAGIAALSKNLHLAGIKSKFMEVPSLSLGSASVTPFELATAYTTLARIGRSCELKTFTEIRDEEGIPIQKSLSPDETIALNPAASFLTVHLMQSVLTEGTAKSAKGSTLPLDVLAGKTGTSNDFRDAWFVGFSPKLLTLVWVGYDENQPIDFPGSVAAFPTWANFMENAKPFLGKEGFSAPEGVTRVELDAKTLLRATERCYPKTVEYFMEGSEPQMDCDQH